MAGPNPAFSLPPNLNALLAVARSAASNRIRDGINRGAELLGTRADGPVALNSFRANRGKWDEHIRELLRRLFTTDALRLIYDRTGQVPAEVVTPALEMERLLESVEAKVDLLRSILDRLDQVTEPIAANGTAPAEARGGSGGERAQVFVVHENDSRLARTVARYLDAQGVSPILVTDSPGEGEIGLDQLDAYLDARFAIVLLAGDQIAATGWQVASATRVARAEPLVWLGYLAGRMGVPRVCGLYQPGVPPPGAALRVACVEFDDAGAWRQRLVERIKASGVEIGPSA